MGWTISVGRAGAANGRGQAQAPALSVRFDTAGMALQLKLHGDGSGSRAADAMPAWQAQRVWQKVLSTVVGFD